MRVGRACEIYSITYIAGIKDGDRFKVLDISLPDVDIYLYVKSNFRGWLAYFLIIDNVYYGCKVGSEFLGFMIMDRCNDLPGVFMEQVDYFIRNNSILVDDVYG